VSDPTTEFFAELERRAHEPLLNKVKSTTRFEIVRGKQKSRWLVTVDSGALTVSRRNAAADSVVRADGALFDQLVTGRANAMAEVLRGRIGVEGDPESLILLQRLFPGPPLGKGRR
jgi:predicted lipid carrier protein YhbT